MDLGKYTRKVLKRVLVFYVQTEDCSLGMILNIVCEVYGGEVRLNILSFFVQSFICTVYIILFVNSNGSGITLYAILGQR
jgi:hypothetical protein